MSTVWLFVRREIREKLRSRPFLITNAVLLLVLVAAIVVPALLGGGDDDGLRIGAVGAEAQQVADAAVAGFAAIDREAEVTEVADEATARQELTDEQLDVVLLDASTVLVDGDLRQSTSAVLEASAAQLVLGDALREAGIDLASLEVPRLEVVPLDGEAEADDGPDGAEIAIGFGATFILYGLLIFYGQQIATGIVQEKQSRVIEVLLSSVRPGHLLGGKLLGLGLLGLAQIVLLAGVAAIALQFVDTFEVPASALPALAATAGWFLLGYALYAALFALTAAVVPKVEDLQSAMMLPIVVLVSAIFLAQFAITDPGGTVATVGAYLPTSAPVVQPLMVAQGDATLVGTAIAAAGVLATTAVLIPLAARVHGGAALATRRRVKLSEALRRQPATAA